MNLDTAILCPAVFIHVGGNGVALASANCIDDTAIDANADEIDLHRCRASLGQCLVVRHRADAVSIADDIDVADARAPALDIRSQYPELGLALLLEYRFVKIKQGGGGYRVLLILQRRHQGVGDIFRHIGGGNIRSVHGTAAACAAGNTGNHAIARIAVTNFHSMNADIIVELRSELGYGSGHRWLVNPHEVAHDNDRNSPGLGCQHLASRVNALGHWGYAAGALNAFQRPGKIRRLVGRHAVSHGR